MRALKTSNICVSQSAGNKSVLCPNDYMAAQRHQVCVIQNHILAFSVEPLASASSHSQKSMGTAPVCREKSLHRYLVLELTNNIQRANIMSS